MKIEKIISKRTTREHLQRKIAVLLARLTDRTGRLVLAPEAVLIRRLGLKELRQDPRYKIREALRRMEKKGLVLCERTTKGWTARLAPAGKAFVKKLESAENIRIKKPAHWDGRWRIVAFDVWERRRGVRNRLRFFLKKAGFCKLQASLWVHPYDCEDLVALLRAEMRLGGGVVYIIAEGIENDFKLRQYFRLR